jgi:hypothetical protein
MLSDEEKKAIERFKNFIYTCQDVIEDEYSDYEEKESAKEYQEVSEKILDLIEKQQKEIEELKEIYQTGYVNGCVSKVYEINKKWEDKIKAKIEELKQDEDFYREQDRMYEYEGKLNLLQSLLEKE